MPVKGSGVAEPWPGKHCSPSGSFPGDLLGGREAPPPFPLNPSHLPLLQLLPHPLGSELLHCLFPTPTLSWWGWPTGPWRYDQEVYLPGKARAEGEKPHTTSPCCSPGRQHTPVGKEHCIARSCVCTCTRKSLEWRRHNKGGITISANLGTRGFYSHIIFQGFYCVHYFLHNVKKQIILPKMLSAY